MKNKQPLLTHYVAAFLLNSINTIVVFANKASNEI